jgi:hypothetical protein
VLKGRPHHDVDRPQHHDGDQRDRWSDPQQRREPPAQPPDGDP